jgi:hypothetical protein
MHVLGGRVSTFTCDQFSIFFFIGEHAAEENRLQDLWNALRSVRNWGFIRMVSLINNFKGLVR